MPRANGQTWDLLSGNGIKCSTCNEEKPHGHWDATYPMADVGGTYRGALRCADLTVTSQ
jgi:hypothetical protein